MKRFAALPLAALVFAGACSDSPTAVNDELASMDEIVITRGIATPISDPGRPSLATLKGATLSVGGSSTSALTVNGTQCTSFPAQQVKITYTVAGNQTNEASFDVNTKWDHNGTNFVGSVPTTVKVAAGQGSKTYQVPISVENSSETGSGNTSFAVAPQDVKDGGGTHPLKIDATSSATVHVAFNDCTPPNTAPSLTIPADMTVEAESKDGAKVTFIVSVNDLEDEDLQATCSPASGSIFALGETAVNCSVTDSGGLSDSRSFVVNVRDTREPVISGVPTSPVTLIATSIAGATFDASRITATDLVDGSVTVACSPLIVALGATQEVTCTATDNAGNPATAKFNVSVTLGSIQPALLSPIKADGSSVFKMGSTAPVKFAAPSYTGGVADDLATGLKFTLTKLADDTTGDLVVEEVSSTASSAWRYDNGQYIFNLGTKNLKAGTYKAVITHAGITLGEGQFGIRK